ncbi:hypothetical protein Q8G71_36235, partial [Klebsiella pneumoniae]
MARPPFDPFAGRRSGPGGRICRSLPAGQFCDCVYPPGCRGYLVGELLSAFGDVRRIGTVDQLAMASQAQC